MVDSHCFRCIATYFLPVISIRVNNFLKTLYLSCREFSDCITLSLYLRTGHLGCVISLDTKENFRRAIVLHLNNMTCPSALNYHPQYMQRPFLCISDIWIKWYGWLILNNNSNKNYYYCCSCYYYYNNYFYCCYCCLCSGKNNYNTSAINNEPT